MTLINIHNLAIKALQSSVTHLFSLGTESYFSPNHTLVHFWLYWHW